MKNKKLLMPLTGVAALGAIAPVITLTGCNNSQSFTVQFVSNGGSAVKATNVKSGEKLETPEAPTRLAYTFTGWYTDQECTILYDFTKAVTSNMILYAGWEAQELTLSVPAEFNLNFGYGKNADGDSIEYYTTKQIRVYDENGKEIESSNLEFVSSRPAVAMVDSNGVIYPASGLTGDSYSIISVYLKGELRPFASTIVDINKKSAANSGIQLNTLGNLEYSNYECDENGVCVIPDHIYINNSDEHAPYLTMPTGANLTSMKKIKTLILPNNFGGVSDASFADVGGNTFVLQNILFNGTKEEFDSTYLPYFASPNWVGNKVIGVDCIDGLYSITGRYDTSLGFKEDEEQIVLRSEGFNENQSGITFRFDYSKFGTDLLASKNDEIIIENAQDASCTFQEVYIDGVLQTPNTDYTVNDNTLTFDSSVSLNARSNVVVKCTFHPASGKQAYINCQAEWPTSISVVTEPKRQYKVGDKFTISGLVVRAEFPDGSRYIVPNNYLEFYVSYTKQIKPGYAFQSDDVSLDKVYVYDSITNLYTTFPISVEA